MKYSDKAMSIKPSTTLKITAKAKELISKGEAVISFSAGEPDFNTPDYIKNAAIKAIRENHTGYTPTAGILELRQVIANKMERDNGIKCGPENVIVGTGAKQSISIALQAILNEGDEVLIIAPYWLSYPEMIKLAGGIPVLVATGPDMIPSKDTLAKAITDKTRAIIINSPSNPTGAVYSKEKMFEIADLAIKNDLFIISDEIYERLIYNGRDHVSIASFSHDLFNRTITINGVSKAYAMTGWRIGYAVANKDIIDLMVNIQSHQTSNTSSISQMAALAAIRDEKDQVENMRLAFDKRRQFMIKRLKERDDIHFIEPEGAFYVFVNIKAFIGGKYRGEKIAGPMDFANHLLEDYKVALIPSEGFASDEHIRLSYAINEEMIDQGINSLYEFLDEISL